MSVIKKIPIIFLAIYILTLASDAAFCRHECSKRKCEDNYLNKSTMIDLGNNSYVCPKNVTFNSGSSVKEFPYVVGWSDQCAIPAGGGKVSNASCLSTNNFFHQAISTVLTFGVGKAMMDNFCSFVPGDVLLEGGIITTDFLSNCLTKDFNSHNYCLRNLLRGRDVNDVLLSPNWFSTNVTNNPCNGVPNLDRPVIDKDGKFVLRDGKQVYCPLMRCNIPTEYMAVRYHGDKSTRTEIMAAAGAVAGSAWSGPAAPLGAALGAAGGAFISAVMPACCDNPVMSTGGALGYSDRGVDITGIVQLRSVDTDGDRTCTEVLMDTGWVTLGCKFRSPPLIKMSTKPQCQKLHDISCSDSTKLASKSFMPITSRMMQCVTELLYVVFKWGDCSIGDLNPIAQFQERMRDVVQVILVLYVILFGIRVALGVLPKKSDIWIFIFKICLVSYFVIGGFKVTDPNAGAEAADIRRNGLELLFDGALGAMHDFANIVAGNDTVDPDKPMALCKYNRSDYQNNTNIGLDYSFLALWDSFDCRLMFYMGFAIPTKLGQTMVETPLVGSFTGGLISYIWALVFSFNWVFLIFLLIFSVLLLSITIFLAHLYIIAMIAITIMIFMGPIFIPMALFERTKGYFDSWLRLLISYTLQPAIIIAFVVIMTGVIDEVLYKGCMGSGAFTQVTLNNGKPYWVFQDQLPADAIKHGCDQSLGYKIAMTSPGENMILSTFLGIFPIYLISKAGDLFTMIKPMMLSAFFMFLFYYFAQQLARFAADVAQSANLGGQAIGATQVFDTAASAAADYATGGGYSKAKQAAAEGGGAGIKVAGPGGGGSGVGGGGGPKRKGISVTKST